MRGSKIRASNPFGVLSPPGHISRKSTRGEDCVQVFLPGLLVINWAPCAWENSHIGGNN